MVLCSAPCHFWVAIEILTIGGQRIGKSIFILFFIQWTASQQSWRGIKTRIISDDVSFYILFLCPGPSHMIVWNFHLHDAQQNWHSILWSKTPPPHSCSFTSGWCLKISLAVILLTAWIILLGLFVGMLCIKKWTWSLSVPISMNSSSYRFDISRQIPFNVTSTDSLNTTRRYLAGHTKW